MEPVVIASQPQSLTVNEGDAAAFTVTAIGGEPLSYQWQRNGENINGATAPALAIPVTQAADDADYRVIVKNPASSATSQGAWLQVIPDFPDLARALDAAGYLWTTGGNVHWFPQTNITSDGIAAAMSGAIVDDQQSWLQVVVNGPGQMEFQWKVSSEQNFDLLVLSVDGEKDSAISGEVDWTLKTLSLTEGTHTLRWAYSKDGSESVGMDAAWLDQVNYAPEFGVSQPIHLLQPDVRPWDDLFQFDLLSFPGETLTIEGASVLNGWGPLATITNVTGKTRYVDPDSGALPNRFYQITQP